MKKSTLSTTPPAQPTPPSLPPAVDLDLLVSCYKDDPLMTHTKWVRWAADCAERVLPLFEVRYPDDMRPRQALVAVREWLLDPSEDNHEKAFRAAAYAAADAANAAWAAARAAARAAAANAAWAAAYATRAAADTAANAANAAYAAADTAAYAAADAAAHNTEKQWQTIHLMEIYHEQ